MKEPLEKDIQQAICDYLALKRHCFWRQNTAPAFDWKSNSFCAMPKHSKRGVSDIILIKQGRTYFLEVKRPSTKQSFDQRDFEADVTAAGATYAVLRSVDDAIALGL